MFLQGVAIFCLAIVQYSLCYDEMDGSKDPILQYLQLDTESLPEHELVKIELSKQLHKRAFSGRTMPAGTRLRIRAFGDNVNLWLHPRDPVSLATDETPVYFSRHAPGRPGNVNIVQQHGLMRELGKIFEDPEYLASLVIGKDDYGRTTVNGIIGSTRLAIRSLPKSVIKEYVRKRRSIDGLDEDFLNSMHHVVYRIKDDFQQNHSLGAFNVTMLRERAARSTSGIPYTIYPKILVVADYSTYKAQGSEIYNFLEYLLAFWNGVDLKYRVLENPNVRLHISGILIGMDLKAIPYIFDHMLSDDAFEARQAFQDSSIFFIKIQDSIPLNIYDIPVTTTRFAFGLGANASVIGKGSVGSACRRTSVQVLSIGMARDNGLFSGVYTAAHELGHILGMKHDQLQSDDCNEKNGFIMSTFIETTENSTLFSTCSLENLKTLLDEQRLSCMYEPPQMNGKKLANLMPGRIVSLKEQCSIRGYQLPCNISNSCSNIHCLETNGYCRKINRGTLEGTPCSEENERIERFCVHGRCVRV